MVHHAVCALALAGLLGACTGGEAVEMPPRGSSGSGEEASDVTPAELEAAAGDALPAEARREAAGRLVHMGRLRLAPGARFDAPTSVCQEVLAYVESGTVEVSGGGVGQRRSIDSGAAVRFGPEAGGRVDNDTDEGAVVFVAFVRATATPFVDGRSLEASLREPPFDEACGQRAVSPERVASEVEPLVLAGGNLRVTILLDEAGQGASLGALSLLEATPDIQVPEHVHEASAEVLFIAEASGSMRYGEERVPVTGPTTIYIPAGLPHDFQGDGTAPLRALQVYAPAGPEQRFRALAAAAEARAAETAETPTTETE